ncbi:hypothetical protein Q8W90_28400 [Pseudomonas aeruginosa]|uniref:hypothetical protein n=1 Tax=Pseudomonas aeruginosa TaxID=287 RepID=UPI001A195D3E|nr:hypothetical protein [Pseudomonas aeruginosa]MBG7282119.1 hypothetical protein [Pseudomonas aeruginosa]MDI3829429.1 hypothetical protein [Pseudomonas aeruginosa]MDU0686154.1 hypothetical protein [Pseudomonas aeruginosa]HBN9565033.1 hypothetical protein [Pseudomonas aeruginosa]HBO3132163.1 hypothetical protein [Pseudomonas aeruginosa]
MAQVTKNLWAKMPNAWIREGGLALFGDRDSNGDFSRGELNTSLACLKTYVAICTRTDFETGVARTTYAELSQLTEQSRSVVSRSLALLEAYDLIDCDSPSRGAGTYITVSRWLTEKGFAKIPKRWLLTAREATKDLHGPKGTLLKFRQFRFESRLSLIALKVYLVLLAYRDSGRGPGDGLAIISYTRIAEVAGIGRHLVSDAVTKLLEMNLLTFRTGDYREGDNVDFDRTNRYLIRGLNVQWQGADEEAEGAKRSKKSKRNIKGEIEATRAMLDAGAAL